MKALVINGSPTKGTTFNLTTLLTQKLEKAGIEFTVVEPQNTNIRYCIGCTKCYSTHRCVLRDDYSKLLRTFDFDVLIVLTPIYFFGVTAQTKTAIDRLCSVNLNNKKIVLVTVSGSNYINGGADIVYDEFTNIAEFYDKTKVVSSYHKTTNDQVLLPDEKDDKYFDSVIKMLLSRGGVEL